MFQRQEYQPLSHLGAPLFLIYAAFGKVGTINQIINQLIVEFHKNYYCYRFANNWSFNLCVFYFTIFTLSIQTPQLLTILNLKFE